MFVENKIMKSLKILSIIVSILGITLCFVWFDWKLFVVLFLLFWGNNMDLNIKFKK